MKTTTITCDSCEKDLTTTGNSIDYRLALKNERIPCRSGPVTCMMKYPALENDVYFCGLNCLYEWIDSKRG